MNVLTIGSALVDIFIHSPSFMMSDDNSGLFSVQAVGGKLGVENMFLRTGGGGSNTAVGFARLGLDVAVVAEIGKDEFGEVIANDFHKEKVNTEFLVRERKEQTGGSIILVCDNGQRTVLVHRGAAAELNPHDLPLDNLELADWVHLSSISGQLDTLQHLAKEVRNHSVAVSWNPGMKEIELCLSGALDPTQLSAQVLLVNEQEWSALLPLHQVLLSSIPEIIVTRGEAGGWVFTGPGEGFSFPAITARSIDVTGAGDAFITGYVAARLYKETKEQAVRWGAMNAASVVQRVGAKPGLLTTKDLLRKE